MIDYTSYMANIVPKTPRIEKKYVANPSPEDLAEVSRTALSEGVMEHPIVQASTAYPADYYRRGGPFRPIEGSDDPERSLLYQSPMPRHLADPEQETIASIRLFGRPNRVASAKPVDLIPPFSKFFLESVQEGHAERNQIVETFGDFFVFFFGERPPVYNFSGMLLNADTINWAEDFYFYYDNFLRGTKCVEAGAVLVITYGYRQIEGFILGMNMSINAISERGIPLSFQVLVTDRKNLKLSADFGVMEMEDGKFKNDTALISMLQTGMSDGVSSESYMEVKKVAGKEKAAVNTTRPTAGKIGEFQSKFPGQTILPNPNTGGMKIGNLA